MAPHGGLGAALVLALALLPTRIGVDGAAAFVVPARVSLAHNDTDRASAARDYRHSYCDALAQVRAGESMARDALQGRAVSVLLRPGGAWLVEDPEEEGRLLGGHQMRILDEVSRRAGFTWRDTLALTRGKTDGDADWTAFALYKTKFFDVVVDWYIDRPLRRDLGLAFPYNFLDLSLVLVTRIDPTTKSLQMRLFSWLSPFDLLLWMLLLLAIFYTAVVFFLLERHSNKFHFSSRTAAKGLETSFFHTFSRITWSGNFTPKTTTGRILTLSWSIVCLVFFSSYTARLASALVLGNDQVVEINALTDATNGNQTICVELGTIADEYMAKNFPALGLVRVAANAQAVETLRDGGCSGVVLSLSDWRNIERSKSNIDCRAQVVGQTFKYYAGGWVMEADLRSEELCLGLLRHVLDVHLGEMEEEGFFERVYQEEIEAQAYVDCEAGNGQGESGAGSQQLTIDTIGGLFLLHGIISVVCIGCAAYDRRWSLLRWGPAPGHQKMSVDEIKAIKKTGRMRKVLDKGLERQTTLRQDIQRSASGRLMRSRFGTRDGTRDISVNGTRDISVNGTRDISVNGTRDISVNGTRDISVNGKGMSIDDVTGCEARDQSMSIDMPTPLTPTPHERAMSMGSGRELGREGPLGKGLSLTGRESPGRRDVSMGARGDVSHPPRAAHTLFKPKTSLSDRSNHTGGTPVDPGEAFAQLEELLRMKDSILMAFAASQNRETSEKSGQEGSQRSGNSFDVCQAGLAAEPYRAGLAAGLAGSQIAAEASLCPPAGSKPAEEEEGGAAQNGVALTRNGGAELDCVLVQGGRPNGLVSVSDFV